MSSRKRNKSYDDEYNRSHKEERHRYYIENRERKRDYYAKIRKGSYSKNHVRGIERRLEAIKIMGGKCARCGYDSHAPCLEFHHIDPSLKTTGITASSLTGSYKKTMEELRKTVLLCNRCHRELHGGLWSMSEVSSGR